MVYFGKTGDFTESPPKRAVAGGYLWGSGLRRQGQEDRL